MVEYVNRDFLIESIKKDCLEQVYYTKEDAINCIEAAPEEDVAPVIHANWIDRTEEEGYWKCSNCEEPWVLIDGTPAENKMSYCPNCGAKMED